MGVLGITKTSLLLFLTSGFLATGMTAGCNSKEAPTDPIEGYRMAVVDMKPLVELHPSYSKLEQLNQKIGELQQKKIEMQNKTRNELIKKGTIQMDEAMENAKKKLEAERAAVEGEIAALNSSLSAQMNSEMSALQSGYSAELEEEIKKIKEQMGVPAEQVEAPPLDTNVESQVKDFMSNLMLVRERNLAAKRLAVRSQPTKPISRQNTRASA